VEGLCPSVLLMERNRHTFSDAAAIIPYIPMPRTLARNQYRDTHSLVIRLNASSGFPFICLAWKVTGARNFREGRLDSSCGPDNCPQGPTPPLTEWNPASKRRASNSGLRPMPDAIGIMGLLRRQGGPIPRLPADVTSAVRLGTSVKVREAVRFNRGLLVFSTVRSDYAFRPS
jgi:hypothetical protein